MGLFGSNEGILEAWDDTFKVQPADCCDRSPSRYRHKEMASGPTKGWALARQAQKELGQRIKRVFNWGQRIILIIAHEM